MLGGCGPTASVPYPSTPIPGGGQPSANPTEPGETDADPTVGSRTLGPHASPTPFTGQVWQPLPDFPSGDAFEVTGVTVSGTGFAAVGFQQVPGEGFFGRRQGVVWRSDDGRVWQSTVDTVFQFVTPEEVVSLGDSLFVFGTIDTCDLSLAEECVEPPDSGWAVWRSTAGGAWERLPQQAQMQTGTIDGLVSANGMLVAHGWAGEEAQSIVWTSTDGATWASTTDLAEMDPVTAMGAAPTGLVAFGTKFASEAADLELVAAAATDGAHFARVPAPALPSATVHSVAAGPLGMVAVGEVEDIDLAFTGVALYSIDGLSWTQIAAPDESFANSAITLVHAVRAGYVAIGVVPQLDDFGISTGASWFSSDGQSWQALASLGGRFSQLTASAAGPTGIVAFTVTEEEPEDETVVSTISAWFAPVDAFSVP
ncbi:MAG: hypothetical protein ACR2KS_05885 [Candidatus Eremiobacter antarcticus]